MHLSTIVVKLSHAFSKHSDISFRIAFSFFFSLLFLFFFMLLYYFFTLLFYHSFFHYFSLLFHSFSLFFTAFSLPFQYILCTRYVQRRRAFEDREKERIADQKKFEESLIDRSVRVRNIMPHCHTVTCAAT